MSLQVTVTRHQKRLPKVSGVLLCRPTITKHHNVAMDTAHKQINNS